MRIGRIGVSAAAGARERGTAVLWIYRSDATGRLETVAEIERNTWVHLVDPTEAEIGRVAGALGLPADFLHDPLDAEERPRVEKDDAGVLIILSVPYPTAGDPVPYRTIPVGIIHTRDVLVTVCRRDHPVFRAFTAGQVKGFYTHMKTRFTLQFMFLVARYYLHYLNDLNARIVEAEAALQRSMRNQEVYILLNINKSLVYFTTALKVNRGVMQKLTRETYMKMYEDDEELLQDAIIEMQQALDASDIHSENLSNLMDAYAAIIQNNVNTVLKILTALTIILAIPTMIASIYGMNVPLPYQDSPYAFPVLMGISTLVGLSTGYAFWRMRLF